MEKRFYLMAALSAAILAFPSVARADDDDSEPFLARITAGVDYKIDKGLHLQASEEVRLYDFGFNRSVTTVGLEYKAAKWLKIGADYNLIGIKATDTDTDYSPSTITYTDWRHRFGVNFTESLKAGQFTFSLRERFQATYDSEDINTYQRPQTALALRTRFKVSYRPVQGNVRPYLSVEPRFMLNGCKWDSNSTTSSYSSSEYLGNKDVYLNRVRTRLGADWRIDKHSSIEFYGLYDYLRDKNIDSKRKSAILKEAITTTTANRFGIGIGYVYSF